MKRPEPGRGRARSATWLGWGLWLLVVAVRLVTFVALILSRRSRNVIGWLCWAIGFTLVVSNFGSDQAAKWLLADSVSIPVALALQLGQVAYLLHCSDCCRC